MGSNGFEWGYQSKKKIYKFTFFFIVFLVYDSLSVHPLWVWWGPVFRGKLLLDMHSTVISVVRHECALSHSIRMVAFRNCLHLYMRVIFNLFSSKIYFFLLMFKIDLMAIIVIYDNWMRLVNDAIQVTLLMELFFLLCALNYHNASKWNVCVLSISSLIFWSNVFVESRIMWFPK